MLTSTGMIVVGIRLKRSPSSLNGFLHWWKLHWSIDICHRFLTISWIILVERTVQVSQIVSKNIDVLLKNWTPASEL